MTNEKCDHCGARWGIGDNQWIDVRNKIPKEYEHVLFTDLDDVFKGFYTVNDFEVIWTSVSESSIEHVTHWIPLPKPPGE